MDPEKSLTWGKHFHIDPFKNTSLCVSETEIQTRMKKSYQLRLATKVAERRRMLVVERLQENSATTTAEKASQTALTWEDMEDRHQRFVRSIQLLQTLLGDERRLGETCEAEARTRDRARKKRSKELAELLDALGEPVLREMEEQGRGSSQPPRAKARKRSPD
ncbi:Hypothetical protein SMAX5B_000240 [Scophthalmus maximus]|uniref:Uncharacterized protein n=1 Tax=Scophthalmus maximus TaxID=52904 RepID=A0A2U9BWP1_SCOMX|nr:Hypothetical protein SMAX5B_000240 [Scophthalmus maximus]KAF0034279.1 hypothetical protein F2P81_014345 [Scophthalmus maximus]